MDSHRKRPTPHALSDQSVTLDEHSKIEDLSTNTANPGEALTDNMGHVVSDDQNTLKAGERGPGLLEDFFFREKMHHFDHERIPERVVHARGTGAHGYFELTESLEDYTHARVLTQVGKRTPVFVRFSTVVGFRGSPDTPRDVRGFAVKLYTEEGNWDLVGNNIPVFFIQDAIKFPDLVHAIKPEPHNEIPQAASAHDTFFDFISLTPESMHMMMWLLSDRTLPRAFDNMEGFGVHTFRLINAAGESHFVKFHWKPVLGVKSLLWDESQKIAGKDPDFQRRKLWETLDEGGTLEWEFGVQIFSAEQAGTWDFDILDATKIVPEDLVPVRRVGRLVLNRNVDNFFAETEQVAFMPTNIVPGIDFTNDPLLQGRTFSYLDTQLLRLGGPNWQELPINRPLAPVHNNQRDGHMRQTINRGRVSYFPNRLGGNKPTHMGDAGFVSYPEEVRGTKRRARAESFGDHYGQARLFWNSMTPVEKEHMVKAWSFELAMCEEREVRVRMLEHLARVNEILAEQVAYAIGELPQTEGVAEPGGAQDSADEVARLAGAESPTSASGGLHKASALSMEEGQPQSAKGRKVAVLVAPGVDAEQVAQAQQALKAAGAQAVVIGPRLGEIAPGVHAEKSLINSDPVLFDALLIPGGEASVRVLAQRPEALHFVADTYRHAKPLAAIAEGHALLSASPVASGLNVLGDTGPAFGILKGSGADATLTALVAALAQHRFWGRPQA
ncbi:catalase [Deinococcus reticulitermitis]|uniref:Catalase n=1 Tax=Deinococcus reticulitermitis TaxID=856736 RepID=A0A1H6YDN7_9DEIO|nr:catalase [Deinococcus reticulitermitis]SEJ34845.1 catalase [Deinococcus reticulitermitis]